MKPIAPHFPVLLAVFSLASLVFCAAQAQDSEPKMLYVSDRFVVPLRKTGCNNCTIVHYGLPSGTAVVDLGETLDDWSKIRTTGGIEGWMESRFLLDEPVAREQIAPLNDRIGLLENERDGLLSQIQALSAELETMGLSINLVEPVEPGETARLRVSGDLLSMDTQNEELLRRNQILQQERDFLVAQNDRLSDDAWRTWFVYGASAMLTGFLLSVILPRLRPRKRYSEWG